MHGEHGDDGRVAGKRLRQLRWKLAWYRARGTGISDDRDRRRRKVDADRWQGGYSDGRRCGNGDLAHRSKTAGGARLFIVD